MKLEDWAGLRKKWVEARDKAKVAKGAAKVNMGESMDKVAAATKKSMTALSKAATDLVEACKKYRAGPGGKSAPLMEFMTKNVEAPAKKLAAEVGADATRIQSIREQVKAFLKRYDLFDVDGMAFHKISMEVLDSNGKLNWKDASEPEYKRLREMTALWKGMAEKIKTFAQGVKTILPGKAKPETFVQLADKVLRSVGILEQMAATQNEDWMAFGTLAKHNREIFLELSNGMMAADKAIDGLLAA